MENIKSIFSATNETSPQQKVKQKMSTRQMVGMAMLAAISIVFVSVIHFPLFPAAAFLEYDPADIPILIGTFTYGPIAGFILTIVVSLIQGTTVSAGSGPIGIIMHIVATGSCTLISGSIKNKKGCCNFFSNRCNYNDISYGTYEFDINTIIYGSAYTGGYGNVSTNHYTL